MRLYDAEGKLHTIPTSTINEINAAAKKLELEVVTENGFFEVFDKDSNCKNSFNFEHHLSLLQWLRGGLGGVSKIKEPK